MKNAYGEKDNLSVQLEKLKGAPLREKLEWFFQYYGFYTLIAVAVIAAIVVILVTVLGNRREEILNAMFWDVSFESGEDAALKSALAEALDVDETEYGITLNSSYTGTEGTEYYVYQQQAVLVRVAGKTIDVVGGRLSGIVSYVNPEEPDDSIYASLDTVLSEELLRRLEESGRIRTITTKDHGTLPYFVCISESPVAELLGIRADDYCIGITCTAPHQESVTALLELVLSGDTK